jgi:hypothetical protein
MSHPEAIFAARTVTIQRVVTNTFGEASERNFGLIHVRFGQKLPRVPARGAAAIPLKADAALADRRGRFVAGAPGNGQFCSPYLS